MYYNYVYININIIIILIYNSIIYIYIYIYIVIVIVIVIFIWWSPFTPQFKKIIFLSVNVEVGTARPAASAYEPAAHHLIKVCLDEYIYRYSMKR